MNKGLEALEKNVLAKGLCAACGACVSLCPYLSSWQGRIVKLDSCDLGQGRCFAYCPFEQVRLGLITPEEAHALSENVSETPQKTERKDA